MELRCHSFGAAAARGCVGLFCSLRSKAISETLLIEWKHEVTKTITFQSTEFELGTMGENLAVPGVCGRQAVAGLCAVTCTGTLRRRPVKCSLRSRDPLNPPRAALCLDALLVDLCLDLALLAGGALRRMERL